MSFSALAVRRPVTTVMVVSIAVLIGLVSLSGIGLDLLPDLSFPVIAIITEYPGAGPQEVESLISRPLEEAMSIVSGVREVQSQSTEGKSMVMAEFDWGSNMDMAALEVREKVDLVRGFLPSEAQDPLVIKADPSLFPTMQINLSGASDILRLTTFAEDVVKPRLEQIAGVSTVTITGGATREVKVAVDQARLQGYGLSLDQVTSTLRAENLDLPGGFLEESKQRSVIRTVGEFASLGEIAEIRMITPLGTAISLGDIAEVTEELADTRQISRLNGNMSVGLSIQKQSGENTALVSRRLHYALNDLLDEAPPGVEMVVSMDQARFINIMVYNVIRNMIVGGLLAVVLLYFFLRSLKTTFIVALAIPTSVIATFSLLYFAKLSLNLMTLGGLALGIGMLVDNSIVVLESIFRHRQMGKGPVEAALEGAKEVGTAVTASTLTTLAVFVPIIFIPGMASEIFSDMAATVAFALLTSLVVSLTLIPVAASRMNLDADARNPWVNRVGGFIETLAAKYRLALKWTMGNRKGVLAASGLVLLVSIALVPFLGSEFMSKFDWGEITINVEMPPGVLLEETDLVVRQIEEAALDMPDVESVYLSAGRTGYGQMSPTDTGTVGIRLKKKRSISTDQAVEDLRKVAEGIPGARIGVESAGGIIGGVEFFGAPVTVSIRGADLDVLETLAKEIKARIETVPGTREVRAEVALGNPEIEVVVDRSKAGMVGLTAAQVAQTVRTAMEGTVATQYRVGGEEIDIRVFLDSQSRLDLEALSLSSPLGVVVPLREIVDFRMGTGPSVITRNGQSRMTQVTAKVTGRDLGSVNRDVRANLRDLEMPSGYSLEYGGETQEMNEAFGDLLYALGFAIVLVYMVLASQFESLLEPLIVMVSLPLALVGVVLSLLLGRFALSIPVMIGLVTLAGIVVNNAIVFLDYLKQLKASGMKREDAIVEAGSVRLRPILMTTLTTVLGMMPLALGIGEGTELQQPMAAAVIGGLSFSTILTLFIVPLIYTVFDDFVGRWRR